MTCSYKHRRRLSIALACLLAVLATGGCGDSAQKNLKTAQLAISRGNSGTALELAEKVLAAQPQNVDARVVLARALLMLNRLQAAQEAIDELIKQSPEHEQGHALQVDWTFLQMSNLLRKSDFVTNLAHQEQFELALSIGRREADWLAPRDDQAGQSLYLRARYKGQQILRLDRILDAKRNTISNQATDEPQYEQAQIDIRKLEQERMTLVSRTLEDLDRALKVQPNHFQAAELYARLLLDHEDWKQLWVLAQALVEQQDLTASLAERMVIVMLRMPDSEQKSADRIKTGLEIQTQVAEKQKNATDWIIASARLHLARNEHDEAKALLDKLQQRAMTPPQRINRQYLMAQCHYGLGHYDKAKQILDKLVTQRANSSDVWTLYAMTLIKTDDIAMAKTALIQAKRLDPNNKLAQELYLELMAQEGVLPEMREEVFAYYRSNPTSPHAISMMARYLTGLGIPRQLRQLLDEEVQLILPLTADHLAILVNGYFFLQDYEQAENFARQLVKVTPQNLSAHLRLTEAMMMLGKEAQVKQKLAELKQQFPDDTASVDQMLGRLYLQRQSFDKAVKHLQPVIELEPNNHVARLLLAQALVNLSLTEEALEHTERVLEEQPHHVSAHAMAARIYRLTGRDDLAREHWRHIDATTVDEKRNPAYLAEVKLAQGKLDEAADVCNRAIANGSADPTLRLMLARIYAQKKQFSEAEMHLLALVRSSPNSPEAYALLAQFYIAQDQFDQGLDQLGKLQIAGGNETLARLAQASILRAAERSPEALHTLSAIYEPLIHNGDRRSTGVADALARLHRELGDDDSALAVYDKLIEAKFQTDWARLRQTDIYMTQGQRQRALDGLDALAPLLDATQNRLRYQVVRRYVMLDQRDKALELVDTWLTPQGPQLPALRWKGDLLLEAGRGLEAAQVFRQAIAEAPDRVLLRHRLAESYLTASDYPAAMEAYEQMMDIDPGARIIALAGQGEIYLGLGLDKQAQSTFDELKKVGQTRDPRAMYANGRARLRMGHDDMAQQELQRIPPFARQYVPAQLLLAQIEQRQRKLNSARQRLKDLMQRPRMAVTAMRELIALEVRNKQNEELLVWADEAIAGVRVPPPLKLRWLNVKIALAAQSRDWDHVLELLEQAQAMSPNRPSVAASRIVILLTLGRRQQALQVYGQSPALAQSPLGPLAAVLVDQPVPDNENESAFSSYLRALIAQDIEAARSAAEQLPATRTLFKSDLLALLEKDEVSAPLTERNMRLLAGAVLALNSGLPQLSQQLAQLVVDKQPSLVPAHAVLVQTQLKLDQPIENALARLQMSAANTALELYLHARTQAAQDDTGAAARTLEKLLAREPANPYIEYELAQRLEQARQIDDAIVLLEKIVADAGPFRLAAGNDLAYQLAEHRSDRLDEAAVIAADALEQNPTNAALRETLGWIEHLRGNNEQALHHLSRSIRFLPKVPEAHYHLGVVYEAVGNRPWARRHVEAAAGADEALQGVNQARTLIEKWDALVK